MSDVIAGAAPEPGFEWRSRLALAAVLATAAAINGCAVPAEPRGSATRDSISEVVAEVTAPVAAAETAPAAGVPDAAGAATPAPEEDRFDLNVNNSPTREFFMGLMEGTGYNMVVHPDVSGQISLSLRQVTLTEVLETIRDVYGYDFRRTRSGFLVLPATLQSRIFEIDYLNLVRSGLSRTTVSSGQISQNQGAQSGSRNRGVSNNQGSGGFSDAGSQAQATGSRIDTRNAADFWTELEQTLQVIIGSEDGREVVVNEQAGVIFARGMPDELRAVSEYLERIHETSQRQVVLEAKIVEIVLNDGFQAGVNWAAVGVTDEGYTVTGAQLSALGLNSNLTFSVNFQGGNGWKSDISAIDGARYVQARITFISNAETQLAPVLSALGFAFIK